MTGADLIKNISEKMYKEGTEFLVYCGGNEDESGEDITRIWLNKSLRWKPGTFDTSMLTDLNYQFYEIVKAKELPKKIEKVGFDGIIENPILLQIDNIRTTLNEIIDYIKERGERI